MAACQPRLPTRKTPPPPLAPPDHYGVDDIAAMLREIGASLVETSQPIQAVEERLTGIAARYPRGSVKPA